MTHAISQLISVASEGVIRLIDLDDLYLRLAVIANQIAGKVATINRRIAKSLKKPRPRARSLTEFLLARMSLDDSAYEYSD
jgi:hypothetical protein